MRVELDQDMLVIHPEDDADRAWIELKLGLLKDGDCVELRRCDQTIGFGKPTRISQLRAAIKPVTKGKQR